MIKWLFIIKFPSYLRRVLITVSALAFLTSCEKGSDGGAAAQPEKKKHPWDLIPEDPELLTGRKIYLAECSLCHDEGEESAPALTSKTEWPKRIEKGIPTLITHAIDGFRGEDGKMPARGGTETLTDEEVAAAVKYMVATQQQ